MLERTSTDYASWHIVPCDRKWYGRLAVTELLIEALPSSTCHGRQPISMSKRRRSDWRA